jgi:cysteinyl-tRNA synthetase
MITINGQKMARSLGNFITLDELFKGSHKLLSQAYSPMTIRFFILQAHYRSTLDFSNEALKAADLALLKLLKAIDTLKKLKPSASSTFEIEPLIKKCFDALNDDLNTAIAIAQLFDAVRLINLMVEGKESLSKEDHKKFLSFLETVIFSILGLNHENIPANNSTIEQELIQLIMNLRVEARNNKDFRTSDMIRDQLAAIGIILNDTKEGTSWERK